MKNIAKKTLDESVQIVGKVFERLQDMQDGKVEVNHIITDLHNDEYIRSSKTNGNISRRIFEVRISYANGSCINIEQSIAACDEDLQEGGEQ